MKKLTTNEFIDKVKKIHHNKYDYSLVNYIDCCYNKIVIICPIHGNWEQMPNNHISGDGCPNCYGTKKLTSEEFIIRSNHIHNNKYTYTDVDYINSKTRVMITCPIHGMFEQTPNHHLRKRGCPNCRVNKKSNTLDFIKKSNIIHNNRYDYSKVDYVNNSTKVDIFCHKHGIFKQNPNAHLCGQGCSLCNNSKCENIISELLTNMGIVFTQQKSFNNCKYKKTLRFDFYIPSLNLCIEYDGIQHTKPHFKDVNGLEFNNTLIRDKIKTEFCDKNGINLLRISHNDNILKKIGNYLSTEIIFTGSSHKIDR